MSKKEEIGKKRCEGRVESDASGERNRSATVDRPRAGPKHDKDRGLHRRSTRLPSKLSSLMQTNRFITTPRSTSNLSWLTLGALLFACKLARIGDKAALHKKPGVLLFPSHSLPRAVGDLPNLWSGRLWKGGAGVVS
jgi:hypothetical protein